MIEFIKKYSKLFEIIFLFILSLTPLLWLSDNRIILGHDAGFRLDPLKYLVNIFYSWDPSYNFGADSSLFKGFLITQAPEALFISIARSFVIGQQLTFIFWFFGMGIAMYIFVNSFFKEKEYWFFRVFASTFYMYNFFLLQAWFIAERAKFSLFIALPLGLLVIYKLLTKEFSLLKGVLIFSFIFFFFNFGSSPPFLASLILVYAITFFYLTLINVIKNGYKEIWNSLKIAFFLLTGFFLINAYYILPQLYLGLNNFNSSLASTGGIQGVLNWGRAISAHTSFLNLLRLQGIPDWYDNKSHLYAADFTTNPFLIFASFVPTSIVILGLLYSKHTHLIKYQKLIYLMFFLFFAGLVMSSGSHAPLGFIYVFLIKYVPGFVLFRTAIYKFGPALWLSLIFLTGFYLNSLLQSYIKRKFIYIISGLLFIVFILIYHYPFFVSNFFAWNPPFTTKVKIPSYVYTVASYINNTPSVTRILLLPRLDSSSADSYAWGFWSLDILPRLFTSKSIVANYGPSSDLTNGLYEAIKNKDEEKFLQLAGTAQLSHILWREDMLYSDKKINSSYFYPIKQNLESFKNVSVEKKIGKWTLYRINSQYYSSLFYAPDSVTYSHIESLLPKDIQYAKAGLAKSVVSDDGVEINKKIMRYSNSYLIEGKCIFCHVDELNKLEQDIKIPSVFLLSDSPFYFLIASKEQKILAKVSKIPAERIYADISFANNRITQMEQIAKREYRYGSENLIAEIADRYKFLMTDVINQTNKLSENDKNQIMIKILAYFNAQYRSLSFLDNPHGLADETFNNLSLFIQNNILKLQDKVWITDIFGSKIKYLVNSDVAGIYGFYVEGSKAPVSQIIIDGKNITDTQNIYLGKGVHKLALSFPINNNLIKEELGANAILNLAVGEKKFFELNNFSDEDIYAITFNYKILSGKPTIYIVERRNGKENFIRMNIERNTFWNSFTYEYKPEKGVQKAYIEFLSTGFNSDGAEVQIDNFKVVKTFIPKVFFLKSLKNPLSTVPKMSFTKINPAKFIVHIDNALDPYFLVFGESYNPQWKIFIKETDGKNSSFNDHLVVNNYANGWFVDKSGSYDIIVEYYPQKVFYLGLFLSGASIIVFSVMLLRVRFKNEKN